MEYVNQPAKTLEEGISNMIAAMVKDYGGFNQHNDNDEVRNNMYNEYKNGFKIMNGQKFIKITNDGSVKAFVVKKEVKHFKVGDLLKPASWRAPAMNSPRGNVLKGNYPIQWTGPLYLK